MSNLPDPPDLDSMKPQMMTASELQSGLESLFGWLNEVEAQPDNVREQSVNESIVERVRGVANMLLSEQRERHSDESAPRGG